MFSLSITTVVVTCGESSGDHHYIPVSHCPALGTSEATATPTCQAKDPPSSLVIRVTPGPALLRTRSPDLLVSPRCFSPVLAPSACSSSPLIFHPRGLQAVPPATSEAVPGNNHMCCAWDPGDREVIRLLLCRKRHAELDRFAQS